MHTPYTTEATFELVSNLPISRDHANSCGPVTRCETVVIMQPMRKLPQLMLSSETLVQQLYIAQSAENHGR